MNKEYKLGEMWLSAMAVDADMNGSVKELNKFHNYETEKITRKASDAA